MNPLALLCMLVVGATANTVSVSYGMNTPAIVSYGPPAAAAPIRSSYTSPSYSAPAPAAVPAKPYSAPAPAAIPAKSYSAPAPAAVPVQSYYSPAPAAVPAPSPAPVQSYYAPAPAAVPAKSYSAPAPVATPVASYAAPAPAAPVASYGSSVGASSAEVVTPIPIMKYNHEMHEGQMHHIAFETGNGINQEEHTHIRMNPNAVGTPEDAEAGSAMVTKTGTIAYTSPEGQRINLQYEADENGFRPTGEHLPVAPSQPIEIIEAIRQFQAAYDLAAKAAAENEAPEQGRNAGSSYGSYAAPAPVARAPLPSSLY